MSYGPSGIPVAVKRKACFPADRGSEKRSDSWLPSGARSEAVTVAGALSVYEIWLESVFPSPFGVIVRGVAARAVILKGTGFAPTFPVAGRTASPAPIVQL